MAHEVARAMGLREPAGSAPVAVLREYLAERRLLLVLDNCEHLLGGVAELVETLLKDTRELRILATSRQPLDAAGEITHPVAPLAVPDPTRVMRLTELAGYEAVSLFTERAKAVLPGFELSRAHQPAVVEICSRLDGLPLAIELAVARLRVLTPEQIRDRLADRALLTRGLRTALARQQTMRGCVEWSHDLCTPAEQLLWARLSVFVGDFNLEAAEGVCADERLPAQDVLPLIAFLLDKSILLAQPEQGDALPYRMLESIRTYGRERLGEIGEEAMLRQRHRDWHQQLAARFQGEWIGPHQRVWLRRLDRMLPDISAALEFSLTDPGQADAAVAMVADLNMFWTAEGLQHQARYWLNRALTAGRLSSPARLTALVFEAWFAAVSGDVEAATMRMRQAQEAAGQLGDAHSHALAALAEGMLAIARGDLAASEALITDALSVFRAENDPYWQTIALVKLTLTKVLLDDAPGAAAAHAAILAICERRGSSWFRGFSAMSLGIGVWKQGDLEGAATQITQSLQLLHRAGDIMATSWCLEIAAWIAADRDQPGRAATLLGAAAALADTMGPGAGMWPELLIYRQQCREQVRRTLDAQAFDTAFEHGHNLPLDEAIDYALGRQPDRSRSSPRATIATYAGLLSTLTRREQEVAALLGQGLSNKEIAAHLVISPRTAEGHVDNLMKKLGSTSRAHAAAMIATMSADTDQGSP